MMTALVRCGPGVEALAVTLSALVSAVAEGLVGDAVVLSEQADDGAARVADALGATYLVIDRGEDPWRRGASLAKRDWVLCLDAGDVPASGWIRAVERFVALSPPDRRFGRLGRRSNGFGARVRLALAGLVGRNRVRAGDVVYRALVLRGGSPGRPARIAALIERDPVFG